MKKLILTFSLLSNLIGFAQTINTIAGNGSIGYSGNTGPATLAQFNEPDGICVDNAGNYYIADWYNYVIRKVSTGGIVTTIAGNGSVGYSGDGVPATNAKLLLSTGGVAVDNAGNIYIADALRVRKVSASGIITTIAGNGSGVYSGDGGQATNAGLVGANGVKVDAAGNIYIADLGNNRIRKVNAAGIITTIAGDGTAGYSGDGGPATAAQLGMPASIAIDVSGNIFIADAANGVVRKINLSGVISSYAGNISATSRGDGGPASLAQLFSPFDVSVDKQGNLFIADHGDFRVRKVNASGTITTAAGDGDAGFSGDGGPATAAELSGTTGVATDTSGNLYIADAGNYRIRKVKFSTTYVETLKKSGGLVISPNPACGSVSFHIHEAGGQIMILDGIGRVFYDRRANSSEINLDISNWQPGTYFVIVDGERPQRFVKE